MLLDLQAELLKIEADEHRIVEDLQKAPDEPRSEFFQQQAKAAEVDVEPTKAKAFFVGDGHSGITQLIAATDSVNSQQPFERS